MTTPTTGVKAQELMIGNYLNYPNGDTFIEVMVYGFVDGKNYIWTDFDDQTDIRELQPIPLTEQWLKEFGFTRKELMFGDPDSLRIFFTKGDFVIESDGRVILFNAREAVIEPKILYLHQLQNLYFALTATHLTKI